MPKRTAALFAASVATLADGTLVSDSERFIAKDGTFELHLAPGSYELTLRHESGARGQFTIEAGAGTPDHRIGLRLQ